MPLNLDTMQSMLDEWGRRLRRRQTSTGKRSALRRLVLKGLASTAGLTSLVLMSCGRRTGVAMGGNPQSERTPVDSRPIGTATTKADGTIVMRLRAEGRRGEIGDAILTYSPNDPDYSEVLRHLGGLKPGEGKLVPPWPDRE